MITAAASLVIYLSAALVNGEARMAFFDDLKVCEGAVVQARIQGMAVTDCQKVVMPMPTPGQGV